MNGYIKPAIDYMNPFCKRFHALKDFKQLELKYKIATVVLTIFATSLLLTVPVFRLLVNRFKPSDLKLPNNEDSSEKKEEKVETPRKKDTETKVNDEKDKHLGKSTDNEKNKNEKNKTEEKTDSKSEVPSDNSSKEDKSELNKKNKNKEDAISKKVGNSESEDIPKIVVSPIKLKLDEDDFLNNGESFEKSIPDLIEMDEYLKKMFDHYFQKDKTSLLNIKKIRKEEMSLSKEEEQYLTTECQKKVIVNSPLYNQSLSSFLKNNKLDDQPDDQSPKDSIPFLKARLKSLEEMFQIKERLKRLTEHEHKFQIRHLFEPWKTSLLKFGLMMDEELSTVKISDLKDIEDTDLLYDFIGSRIIDLSSKEKKEESINLEKTSLDDISLINLSKISIKEVKDYSAIPPLVFAFISALEIKNINVNLLTDKQLHFLFRSKHLVHELSMPQVLAVFRKEIVPEFIVNLSDKQAEELDFSQIDSKRRGRIFQWIFSSHVEYQKQTTDRTHKLKKEDVYLLQKHFTDIHWKNLSVDLVGKLDFSKIDKGLLPTAFNNIFPVNLYSETYDWVSHTTERIQKLEKEQIYLLQDYFVKSHWIKLNVKQVEDFDFSRIDEENKETAFSGIFPLHYQNLKAEQIYILRDCFEDRHWQKLSEEQKKEYELYKKNKE
jgi:hypothetical protein